ncbi:hypothetical protein ABIA39_000078 [Nocardia sp. GAS34]|jgi:hypothetical protein|uniref:hypothetical protein n=1 Tax=unclassified Nocardia TaxID=2637762 RepID=UPI003D1C03AB
MRTRTLVVAAAAAAVAGMVGAGSAAAAAPVVNPKIGGIGIEFDHGETQSLANGPVPALLEQVVPRSAISVSIRPDSQLRAIGNHVYADMPGVINEAASHPDGRFALVVAPGPRLVVVQAW